MRQARVSVSAVTEELAGIAVEVVKANTPVKTGNLRDSWEATPKGRGYEVGTDVPYAQPVEEGTSRMSPRAMARRTIDELPSRLPEAVSRANSRKTNP